MSDFPSTVHYTIVAGFVIAAALTLFHKKKEKKAWVWLNLILWRYYAVNGDHTVLSCSSIFILELVWLQSNSSWCKPVGLKLSPLLTPRRIYFMGKCLVLILNIASYFLKIWRSRRRRLWRCFQWPWKGSPTLMSWYLRYKILVAVMPRYVHMHNRLKWFMIPSSSMKLLVQLFN